MVFSRAIPLVALGVAATLALGACAAPQETEVESTGPVTLEWWTWWSNAELYADEWNAANPDIQITVTNAGVGEEQTAKLLAAVRTGEGPDLALAEYQTLPSYVVSDIALDISEYVADSEDSFSEEVWGLVTLDGASYGVPLDIAPMVHFYRPDKFAEYGLEVPTTWDEYREQGEALKAANPAAYLNVFSPIDAGKFAGLTQQTGDDWWTVEDGAWGVDIDGAGSAKVADYWQGLVDDGIVSAQPWWTPEMYKLVADGNAISFPAGAWLAGKRFISNVSTEHEGLWRAAPMPVWNEGDPTGFMGGATSVVVSTTEHPEQAAAFLNWLGATAEGNSVMAGAGAYPASEIGQKALLGTVAPAGMAVSGQEDFYDILYDAMNNAADVTWGPNAIATYTSFRDEFGRAVEQQSSYRDALTAVQDLTVKDLEDSGFDLIK